MHIILFKENDNLCIMRPTKEILKFATIKDVAEKDVPFECPFVIVDDSTLPVDRSLRDSWEWDNSIVPDGYGGESTEFPDTILNSMK